jgi:hypothetical protein
VLHEHSSSVRQTERISLSEKNKRNYRNRIKHMYKFFEEYYPEYFNVGVRKLTEEDVSDADMFWWKNEYDLIYAGLNVKMIKAFLGWQKKKSNGKTCSHVQLRKYNDAIIWGAKSANQRLPMSYFEEIDTFLGAFRKETTAAKKEGMLDEKDADPISRTLFEEILKWALAEKNVYIWLYSLLQWNCMARSINIGTLALHSFRTCEDNLSVKYDKSKADQTGERLHEKHVYDNPFDPLVSTFMALGVWFSLHSSHFETTENLFQQDNMEENAASGRYCAQLCELFGKYKEQLRPYIRVDHANSHGFRKGSATSACSGTTLPPPISSIAARGEWSLGKVLDLYIHFAEAGDTYLGRILAGFDPNATEFGTLSPHWKLTDPMSNKKIYEAMQLMYSTILSRWSGISDVDPTGVLLYCLASVVYHSDFLKQMAAEIPGHPFSLVPLLSRPELLIDLEELVTLEPGGQMTLPTGVPPHVENMKLVQKALSLCTETLEAVKSLTKDIKESVKEAFEEKAEENGQVTGARLKNMLDGYQKSMVELVDVRLTELRELLPYAGGTMSRHTIEQEAREPDDNDGFAEGASKEVVLVGQDNNNRPIKYSQYMYGGRFWHIPKGFKFHQRAYKCDSSPFKMWVKYL